MFIKSILILAATLVCFVIAPAQENVNLTQAERVVLDNPEVITLELAPLTRRRAAGVYQRRFWAVQTRN